MTEKERLAKQILGVYENNILDLVPGAAGHFFTRAYRIAKQDRYKDIILCSAMKEEMPRFIAAHKDLLKGDLWMRGRRKKKIKYTERQEKRFSFYNKRPEINFLDRLLYDMFTLKSLGLSEAPLAKQFSESIRALKKINFKDIYLDEETIRYDSSYAINSVYALRYLGVTDFRKKLAKLIQSIYFNSSGNLFPGLADYEYQSVIYDLTHLIINDSKYYERYVKSYGWTIDCFNSNLDEILRRVKSTDILAEVGLCYKLCRQDKAHPKEIKAITKRVMQRFKINNIKRPELINKKEHSNCMTMMFFSDFRAFYPGPDLSKNEIVKHLNI